MTYEKLFDQLYERARVKKREIKEKESKEEFNEHEFFKPKGIKKRIKLAFSEMAKSLLEIKNPDKDILEYLYDDRTPDGMSNEELFGELFEEARRKDDDFSFAYGYIYTRYGSEAPFKTMPNFKLVGFFKEIFETLTGYLMLPDNFNADLSTYLSEHFRWVVPIEKRDESNLTGPRIYIQ